MKIAGRIFRNRAFLLVGSWKSDVYTCPRNSNFISAPAFKAPSPSVALHPSSYEAPKILYTEVCLSAKVSAFSHSRTEIWIISTIVTVNIQTSKVKAPFLKTACSFLLLCFKSLHPVGAISVASPSPTFVLALQNPPFTITPRPTFSSLRLQCVHRSAPNPVVSNLLFARPSLHFPV